MDDLERELKLGFLEEADQLLEEAEKCFLAIESNPGDAGIINELFRLAHNLKGSAKAVGFMEFGAFTHLLESCLLKIKNEELKADSATVNLLLACKDQQQVMLDALKIDLNASTDCSELSARLEDAIGGKEAAKEAPEFDFEELRRQHELEAIPSAESLGFVEQEAPPFEEESSVEDVSAPADVPAPQEFSESDPVAELPKALAPAAAISQEKVKAPAMVDETIRVSLSRVDQLNNFVGEMVILQSVLFEQAYAGNLAMIRKTVHQLGKISKELQEASMSLRMIPLKQTFQKMQRIVRDTSQTLQKNVTLSLQGEDTEVEKTVLELIGDPLVHLVRNAVDHGIDSASERAAAGKPEVGNILLRAFHQGDLIILEVQDDGKGIDAEKLRAKAIEKNIIKPGQTLTDKQAINLIFHPGFSTKQQVSDISGRGVGLDVVKTNIERLQGTVEVSTELGKGSKFRVQLPLTLAIIDATTVKLNGQRYAIPMSHIHESVQVRESDIHGSAVMGEMVNLRGESLRVYRLNHLIGMKDDCVDEPKIILISRIDEQPFALLVHDISSMQQIVVKKLGVELSHLVGISGSAILGDGKPALILDLPRLIARAPIATTPPRRANA